MIANWERRIGRAEIVSTHAYVQFTDNRCTYGRATLYRHFDGYPSAVIPDLKLLYVKMQSGLLVSVESVAAWLVAIGFHEANKNANGELLREGPYILANPYEYVCVRYSYLVDIETGTFWVCKPEARKWNDFHIINKGNCKQIDMDADFACIKKLDISELPIG